MSTTVLFVASNAGDNRLVEASFRRSGYALRPCETFSSGRRLLLEQRYALAIVDGTLPDGDGLDLLVSANETPVLLLTEDLDVHARLSMLRAGAADCVGKPYDPLHLAARAVSVVNLRKGAPPVPTPGFARRLLLVDDSATYANALADELHRDGHDVALARTAHDALAFVAVQDLDLVLVDVFLPDMSGVDLCSRLRGIPALRHTPVLLLTGREKSAVRGRAAEAEASDLVVKSRDLESVRMHVRRILSEDRPAPSSRRGELPAPHRSVPPPASHRSVPPPASHRSVPPPSSRRGELPAAYRSVPPPASHRSVPPPSSRRGELPASYRSVPPPASRRDGPASVRDGPPSSRRLTSRADEDDSPLLEQLAAASGLSKLVARGAVERACWRAGVKPSRLAPQHLERVVVELEQALRVFLPPEVVAVRMAEMARLGRP